MIHDAAAALENTDTRPLFTPVSEHHAAALGRSRALQAGGNQTIRVLDVTPKAIPKATGIHLA